MCMSHDLETSTSYGAVAHPSNFPLSLPQRKKPTRILEELLQNLDEVNLSGTRGGL